MTRTPKAASAARTGPTTTDSDAQPVDKDAAAPAPAPAPADDSSDSDSSSEIPLCDAPVVKKRKVEARTSQISMTDSERYKREDAGCAARLKKQEPELLPCRDPDEGEDDGGIGDRFQGYDGFTIKGPPVFR